MASVIKKSEVAKMYPRRDPNSHKGQNGRVLIIGGSLNYFGAPILAGLGALGSGADLVYLLVPECNFDVSRSFYPDFIVRKYPGNFINSRTLDAATELLPQVDAVLVGPGVSEDPESVRVIARIIQKAQCHIVLDAEAIPAIAQLGLQNTPDQPHHLTITPHRSEMDEITEGALPDDPEELEKVVTDFAQKWGITILMKGPRDIVASPHETTRVNTTGNAGMTVGGSGDILAGLTASLIAQHISPYEACQCAAFLNGAAGDTLLRQKGYNFMATDVALELPYTIHSIIG
jgi:NAD(P)H-hydrate epimerase